VRNPRCGFGAPFEMSRVCVRRRNDATVAKSRERSSLHELADPQRSGQHVPHHLARRLRSSLGADALHRESVAVMVTRTRKGVSSSR
jgi:hypothetical protein